MGKRLIVKVFPNNCMDEQEYDLTVPVNRESKYNHKQT
jgi:hypothetical protein